MGEVIDIRPNQPDIKALWAERTEIKRRISEDETLGEAEAWVLAKRLDKVEHSLVKLPGFDAEDVTLKLRLLWDLISERGNLIGDLEYRLAAAIEHDIRTMGS